MENGTDTKNTSRQSMVASRPPTTSPRKRPAMLATLLSPSAMPRWLVGNASVRMAPELAEMFAPPMPWTIRNTMSHMAPAAPLSQSTLSITEAIAKMRKPRLYIRTRPNMSPIRPRLTTSTLVTMR